MQQLPVDQLNCTADTTDAALAAAVDAAVDANRPLVLRGCVASMPAVRSWTDERLRTVQLPYSPDAPPRTLFGLLWDDANAAVEDHSAKDEPTLTTQLPRELEDEVYHGELGRLLRNFSGHDAFERSVATLWLSRGGKRASAHYDTFENLHAMVAGEKSFYLIDPVYALSLYYDFPQWPREAATGEGIGCDHLGCYGYVPFDADGIDLATFPRVAEIPHVLSTTISAGDMLYLPSFWLHYIHHLPLRGVGRNIALTFVQQRTFAGEEEMVLPFGADIARRAHALRQGVVR